MKNLIDHTERERDTEKEIKRETGSREREKMKIVRRKGNKDKKRRIENTYLHFLICVLLGEEEEKRKRRRVLHSPQLCTNLEKKRKKKEK